MLNMLICHKFQAMHFKMCNWKSNLLLQIEQWLSLLIISVEVGSIILYELHEEDEKYCRVSGATQRRRSEVKRILRMKYLL